MKQLFFAFFLLASFRLAAQPGTTATFTWNFDSFPVPVGLAKIYRDTVENPDCIWQIGAPQKPVLDSARSPVNVIITDTVNSYPPNDTSSFIIMQIVDYGWYTPAPIDVPPHLAGFYYVDSDTLTDYGTIEISADSGQTWINVLTDTQYNFFPQCGNCNFKKPVLTGSSGAWKLFIISFRDFAMNNPIDPGDTVYLRFRFISDSTQTNRDGLMYDDFYMRDVWLGIPDPGKVQALTLWPNPATDLVNLETEPGDLVAVYRDGKRIVTGIAKESTTSFSIRTWIPGTYLIVTRGKNGSTRSAQLIVEQSK